MRRPLVIYDFATAPFWISLYTRKIFILFFISVALDQKHGQNYAHRKRKTPRAGEDGAGGEDPEQVDRQDIQRPGGAHRQCLPPQT